MPRPYTGTMIVSSPGRLAPATAGLVVTAALTFAFAAVITGIVLVLHTHGVPAIPAHAHLVPPYIQHR